MQHPESSVGADSGISISTRVRSGLAAVAAFASVLLVIAGYVNLPLRSIDHESQIPTEARIRGLIASMSFDERIGQLFIIDLWKPDGTAATSVDPWVEERIKRFHPGGILLFGRNIVTVDQTRALTRGLSALSRIPLSIATDYEGGVVSRLTSSGLIPATRIPPAAEIGKTADPCLAREIGRVMGAELRALGITMNLAPVADVLTDPDSMIGDRAYSSDPEAAADMVRAVVTGQRSEGVASVVKHFPGHGGVVEDSHTGHVVIPFDLDRLKSVELVPFAAAIDAGAEGVMTGHLEIPAITGEGIPASFSAELITGLLREELGFKGVVMTDSLAMRAISDAWDPGSSAVRAIMAGADMVLHPLDLETAFSAVAEAVRSGAITEERIEESLKRILLVKLQSAGHAGSDDAAYSDDPETIIGSQAHQQVVDRVIRSEE